MNRPAKRELAGVKNQQDASSGPIGHVEGPSQPCPSCGANPGEPCRTKFRKPARYPHSLRYRQPERPAIPDLRQWWRSVARYEGNHPLPRPDGLVVP